MKHQQKPHIGKEEKEYVAAVANEDEREVFSDGGQQISDFLVVVRHTVNRPHPSVVSNVAKGRRDFFGSSVGDEGATSLPLLKNIFQVGKEPKHEERNFHDYNRIWWITGHKSLKSPQNNSSEKLKYLKPPLNFKSDALEDPIHVFIARGGRKVHGRGVLIRGHLPYTPLLRVVGRLVSQNFP
ncbi:SWI/SNF complex subunit SWI3C [Dendrobium catenatum]|uniref:SWI/SNF complex subunit SWI3C n=1 Tax=Dendrobium catenatum TaxID=906689 RepID=A0A2I0XHG6_9ASPA|nr:SWI/SNF complex subunit SWI3C [Dendrobium catenatum]